MLSFDLLYNIGTGAIILVLILLANYYQIRTRRRFSGVIGKVLFWYSLGLAVNACGYDLQLDCILSSV